MRRTHIVQTRCNMILAIPPPTTLGGSFSPGFYLSGTLNVKFDPCGDDAAVAERVSKTLGSMTFRLHQAQYGNRSKGAYVEFGGVIATVINLLSPSSRSTPRSGCRSSGLERKYSQGQICTKRSCLSRVM